MHELNELKDMQRWAESIRESFRDGNLSDDTVSNLDELGFIYDERTAILRSIFKEEHGVFLITKNEVV